MVWGGDGGYLYKGVIDFAGVIVVQITAGVGALVACIVVGKRLTIQIAIFASHLP